MLVNRKYDAIVNNEKIKNYEIDVKTTSAGTHLKDIFNSNKVPFNNPKNVNYIKLLISLIDNKDAIVLDFFAGSGTTAESVLELNKEDGGNRTFILATNNEVSDKAEKKFVKLNGKDKYKKSKEWDDFVIKNGICTSVMLPRVKTIITGKRKDNTKYSDGIPANLKYYQTSFVPKKRDGSVPNNLLKHIKELIQLEYMCKIDDKKIIVCFDEDELDKKLEKHKDSCEKLFIPSNVFLTSEQKQIVKEKEITIVYIPEYYFASELKEVDEI